MKKRETYYARLVGGPGDDMHEDTLITDETSVDAPNPFETPKETTETKNRQEERFQVAENLAQEFLETHADKTNPDAMKRGFFFAHVPYYSALAVASEEEKEDAYQHFEEQLLTVSTFDYRNE